jgi:hypothetical protein
MSVTKKRTLEEIQKDLDTARAAKKEKKIACRHFKDEIRDHPDTIRAFMRKLKLPERLIADLMGTKEEEKIFRFSTWHDKDSDRQTVGAGTAEIILEEWDCTVLLDTPKVENRDMCAARWTGQPWEVRGFKQLDGDSDVISSLNEEGLWIHSLAENDNNICAALASIAFLRFGGW